MPGVFFNKSQSVEAHAGLFQATRPDHGASGAIASRPASPAVSNPPSASTASKDPYGLAVLNMKTNEMRPTREAICLPRRWCAGPMPGLVQQLLVERISHEYV